MLWNRYHFRVVLCWGNQIPETMFCVAFNAFFILLPTWDAIDLLSIDTGVPLVWYWGCVYGVQNCVYMGKENADTRPGSQPRNLSRFIASGGICLIGCSLLLVFSPWMESRIKRKATSFAKVHCIHSNVLPSFWSLFSPQIASNTITVKIKSYPWKVFLFLTTLLLFCFCFFYLEFQVVGHLMKKQPEGHWKRTTKKQPNVTDLSFVAVFSHISL